MTPDSDNHVFVIKLYGEGQWLRGQITHAYSLRRRPIRQLEDILVFLDPYLASMGVQLRPKSQLLLWLSRRGVSAALRTTPPEPDR